MWEISVQWRERNLSKGFLPWNYMSPSTKMDVVKGFECCGEWIIEKSRNLYIIQGWKGGADRRAAHNFFWRNFLFRNIHGFLKSLQLFSWLRPVFPNQRSPVYRVVFVGFPPALPPQNKWICTFDEYEVCLERRLWDDDFLGPHTSETLFHPVFEIIELLSFTVRIPFSEIMQRLDFLHLCGNVLRNIVTWQWWRVGSYGICTGPYHLPLSPLLDTIVDFMLFIAQEKNTGVG